jgi:hypothetical protein
MIELPLDNTPSKEFSVNTPVGVLRFKTQWDSFLGQWFMDILSPTGDTWINRVALTAGTDNLIDGCGIPELRDCALFAIDTNDVGVKANATITAVSEIFYAFNTTRLNSDGYYMFGSGAVTPSSKNMVYDSSSGGLYCSVSTGFKKVTIDGNFAWQVAISGITNPTIGIAMSQDGHVWTGGYAAADTLGNVANLRKYTTSGVQSAYYNVTNPSRIWSLCLDASGNVYTVGVGNDELAKYNSSGVQQWSYDHGADLYGVAVDGSGNVYVTGAVGTGTYTTRKLDSSGSVLWSVNHGAATNGITIDGSGNVYIVGSAGTGGYHFRKYNSSGSLQWSKNHGASLSCLSIDAAGYIWVGGSTGTDSHTIRKYDSSGTLILSRVCGTSVTAMTSDGSGGIFADSSGVPSSFKTITIGNVTYSFKSWNYGSLSAYDIHTADTNVDTITNFVNAINGTGTPGDSGDYGTGTLAHPDVTGAVVWINNKACALLVARNAGVSGGDITVYQSQDAFFTFPMVVVSAPSLEYGNDHGGNHKLDLFNDIGKTYRVFMTFPGDTVINPFTTIF